MHIEELMDSKFCGFLGLTESLKTEVYIPQDSIIFNQYHWMYLY